MFVLARNCAGSSLSNRTADRSYLKRMCKTSADEVVWLQRKDLSLISQSPKRGAKNHAVEVVLEFRSSVKRAPTSYPRFSQAFCGHQRAPSSHKALTGATSGHVASSPQ